MQNISVPKVFLFGNSGFWKTTTTTTTTTTTRTTTTATTTTTKTRNL